MNPAIINDIKVIGHNSYMATCSRKERICTWQFSIGVSNNHDTIQSNVKALGTNQTVPEPDTDSWDRGDKDSLVGEDTDRQVGGRSVKEYADKKVLETDALSRILPRNLLYGHFVAIMALLAKFAKMNTHRYLLKLVTLQTHSFTIPPCLYYALTQFCTRRLHCV